MLGVNKGEVRLASYSEDWRELFSDERKLLFSLTGEHVIDIQHIGSTAINGIQAKPIIDILIGVKEMGDAEKFDQDKLRGSGYYLLPRVKIEGKKVFARFSSLENLTKTHILHVVEYNGAWWNKHTFFRDYLNNNPEAAREYESLKKHLAAQYPKDEASYTEEKKRFVDEILRKNEQNL